MNASIVAYENGVSINQPTPAQLLRWATELHDETCAHCANPNNDYRCATGERLDAALTPDRSWIPDPGMEA